MFWEIIFYEQKYEPNKIKMLNEKNAYFDIFFISIYIIKVKLLALK